MSGTRIACVVDNRAGGGLLAEHGLSLLIETAGERILFDTGAGVALLPNAAKLGLDLGAVTRIVLSHSHDDHTGGLGALDPVCPIHVVAGIEVPSYSRQPGRPMHPLGMPDASLAVLKKADVRTVDGLSEIADGVWLSGPIARVDPLEHVRGFSFDPEGALPCRVPEEQALLTADGVLVTGCCHAGIVNTVESFRAHADLPRIRMIVGGLHLCRADGREIERVVEYLNGLGLERVVLLHCTGEEAGERLMSALGCLVEWGYSSWVRFLEGHHQVKRRSGEAAFR